jgi:hypothetical protein
VLAICVIVAACQSVPAKLARISLVGLSPVRDRVGSRRQWPCLGAHGRASAGGPKSEGGSASCPSTASVSLIVSTWTLESVRAGEGSGAGGAAVVGVMKAGVPGSGSGNWVGSSGRACWIFGRLDGGRVVVVVGRGGTGVMLCWTASRMTAMDMRASWVDVHLQA